jgi:hypothetical protein
MDTLEDVLDAGDSNICSLFLGECCEAHFEFVDVRPCCALARANSGDKETVGRKADF